MTTAEKLAMLKSILRINDTSEDALMTVYLTAAEKEILSWRYSNAGTAATEVPAEYEMTQIYAVINGYTQSGNEGQLTNIENGTHLHFEYSDMIKYIRANVIPIAGVLRTAVTTP